MAPSSIQQILTTIHSRKLLINPTFNPTSALTLPSVAPPPNSFDLLEPTVGNNSIGADTLMVFIVLLCAFICSLGLNAIINCSLKCSRLVSSDDESGNGSSSGSPVEKTSHPGLNEKALETFPVVNYSEEMKIPGLENECVICLMEFYPGEKIKLLPKCNHGFHVKCIDKWLNCHSSCPTCRHCLIETCNKILDGHDSNVVQSSNAALSPGPLQEIIINIVPLEPEGMAHNCQN
ncbi:hypothetical protein LIER_22642 [Lithospermum erythrorhizon]|uniref:RING-type E3 ubiquitin transferase n=1 Tax=Lithospermum erythrorhizon TaxID=34254 RepID=A0AAV3QVW0_LITER